MRLSEANLEKEKSGNRKNLIMTSETSLNRL